MMTNKDNFILAEQYVEWRDQGVPLSYEIRKYVENTPGFDPDKIVKDHIKQAKPKRKAKRKKQDYRFPSDKQLATNLEFKTWFEAELQWIIRKVNYYHHQRKVPISYIVMVIGRPRKWLIKKGVRK